MTTSWQYSPGSKQHWLYGSSSIGSSRIIGMVYEVNPTAFSVYRENHPTPAAWSNREFLVTMPTLDEAKDLLQTLAGAQL